MQLKPRHALYFSRLDKPPGHTLQPSRGIQDKFDIYFHYQDLKKCLEFPETKKDSSRVSFPIQEGSVFVGDPAKTRLPPPGGSVNPPPCTFFVSGHTQVILPAGTIYYEEEVK